MSILLAIIIRITIIVSSIRPVHQSCDTNVDLIGLNDCEVVTDSSIDRCHTRAALRITELQRNKHMRTQTFLSIINRLIKRGLAMFSPG